ncbi:CRISPR-associated protein Cas4 [Treponema sp. TIM-1]|uniref:CRISPR-associated protein Cas4 n=1 Tax=Treponema sp. TIM-1 TaxID=2898417 RepID=UPI003980BEED
MYSEDDLIPVSSLQHILFCERQYALIYLEQVWQENRFTAEGKVLHERVHVEHHESRRSFKQEYDMAVRSLEWGLIGKCDLVEIWYLENKKAKKISPVEFKRGREKESDVDLVQLCAQVLCLEEMFGLAIDQGQLYYLQEHRRNDVCIDEILRKKTTALIDRIRTLRETGVTPGAEYEKRKCDNCSLVDMCMPKSTGTKNKQVNRFMQTQLQIMRKACETERMNIEADRDI